MSRRERERPVSSESGKSAAGTTVTTETSNTKKASNLWTPERRAAASRAIHEWKPWLRATGPTTPEGKARSARNAWKGGVRPQQRELRRQAKAVMAAYEVCALELVRFRWECARLDAGLDTSDEAFAKAALPPYQPYAWIGDREEVEQSPQED